jgi:hypothetical protein
VVKKFKEETMKNFLPVFILVILSLILSAPGQINPEERPSSEQGVFLNFEEEEAEDVDPRDVQQFECDGTSIFEAVANPLPTSPPTAPNMYNSANVGQITSTACTWEGIHINNEFLINFSPRPWITVDVIPPAAGRRVALKLEVFGDNTTNIQVEDTTTVAGEWETLTFDFSGAESGKYGRIVFMPDFEGTTAGETWIFDNIRQQRPPIGYNDGLLADFENKDPWWGFFLCEFDIVDNPDASGINTSSRVGHILTTDAGATWEGAHTIEPYIPFVFGSGTHFTVKVYAPEENRPVRLKIEPFLNNTGTGNTIEIEAITTTAFAWEELEFDFALSFGGEDPADDWYNKVVFFPDFGLSTIDEDWYFDDIYFHGTPTTGTPQNIIPVDFKLHAQNYPNPFNPSTTISYAIPNHAHIKLAVYDIMGREITILVNERQSAGTYTSVFNGSNLSSGVYFYTLSTGKDILTGKMLLIK